MTELYEVPPGDRLVYCPVCLHCMVMRTRTDCPASHVLVASVPGSARVEVRDASTTVLTAYRLGGFGAADAALLGELGFVELDLGKSMERG